MIMTNNQKNSFQKPYDYSKHYFYECQCVQKQVSGNVFQEKSLWENCSNVELSSEKVSGTKAKTQTCI